MSENQPATSYEFDDEGVEGRIDVTSLTGSSGATLTIDGQPLPDATADRQDTRITVEAVLSQTADGDRVAVTLMVPVVQLESGDHEARAKALLVVSTQRSSIGGPQLVTGPLEKLETRKLRGRARLLQS